VVAKKYENFARQASPDESLAIVNQPLFINIEEKISLDKENID
jgi:hypothetical protein